MYEESTTSFCRPRILAQNGQPCPMAGIRGKIIHIPEASALTETCISLIQEIRKNGALLAKSLNPGASGSRQQLCPPQSNKIVFSAEERGASPRAEVPGASEAAQQDQSGPESLS